MRSRRTSDRPFVFAETDLPTTAADVRALRRYRSSAAADWLEQLASLSAQVPPPPGTLRRRPTFAGCAPFEL